jgi:hypothetical protein
MGLAGRRSEHLSHRSPPAPGDALAPATMAPQKPAGSAPASIFRVERAWLVAAQDENWRRVRAVLWVIVVSTALGFLLLIPLVHAPPVRALPIHLQPRPGLLQHGPAPQRPLWAGILLVISMGTPLLALAVGLLSLPSFLWRAARLRRQADLHLAIGRQGLLFFLPGQPRHWFLLPWGHIATVSDATIIPRSGRYARLRTMLWRRLARLRRAFRHGRRLGESRDAGPPVRSPFALRARQQGPRPALRLTCYARLPDRGYGWLFQLAPFTRRVEPTTLLLQTGSFEAVRLSSPAAPVPAGQTQAAPRSPRQAPSSVSLHRLLLGLWDAPLLRAQRPALPLPRSGGAVILNEPAPAQRPGLEARGITWAAWAALPLVPALSVVRVGSTLVLRQPLEAGAALNLAALCALTLGLGLLLAGVQHATRGRTFASGALLLVIGGALNLAYALVVLLHMWPWAFQVAPGEPFLFLEALASLLLILGAAALGIEGSGRPGARPVASLGVDAEMPARPHSTELALALGLLLLGMARVLEDINLATLSSSGMALQLLRNTLAEPLLPLVILGLSYFGTLARPALRLMFRVLQMSYGLALMLLVPAAFLVAQRATGSKALLPLRWTPLLALSLICGLVVVLDSVLGQRQMIPAPSPDSQP